MFDQLPIELVQAILLQSAEDNLHDDRDWVVQLALVSRCVYWLVHPILYRIMVITDSNSGTVWELSEDSRNHHIFGAVRNLHVVGYAVLQRKRLPPALLFTAPTLHLEAGIEVVAVLAPGLGPRLVSLRTQYLSWRVETPIVLRSLASLVRLTLDVRSQLIQPVETQARDLFARLPLITHLAFEFVDDHNITGMFSMADFETFIRIALERHQTARVALRFRGKSLAEWPAFRTMLSGIGDPRVSVWLTMDSRYTFIPRDAWLGKSVWTEAKPLSEL